MKLKRSLFFALLIGAGCATDHSNHSAPAGARHSPLTQFSGSGLPELTPMRGTGHLAPAPKLRRFRFVVFGDNRPATGEPQPETITEIFAEIHGLRPAFALSLGDIIEGKPKPDDPSAGAKIRMQFNDFLALAAKAGVPIFNAPGNHEMDDDKDIPTERMHALYRECVAPSYGAFNYGNSRFIALNTEDVPPVGTSPPPADEEFSYMSPKQLSQLKADLEANRDKVHIFIAMHYPLRALNQGPPASKWDDRLNPADRQALTDLFANYRNISYVLAAHEHLYFNPDDPENVSQPPGWKTGDATRHLISGGAGAPLNQGKWGFHHYLLFEVDRGKVWVTLRKLKGRGASPSSRSAAQ